MKRKHKYSIGVIIIILIFGAWVTKEFIMRSEHGRLFIDHDKVSGLTGMPGSTKETAKKHDKKVGFIELNGEKAKAPKFSFIDQNKDTVTQEDYQGKVYVVEFFYTTCPTICPVMNDNLQEVAKVFKDNPRFGIASFSIDPEHDTPEVLKKYADQRGIKAPNWHFMTGQRDSIYNLAAQGFNMVAQEDINEPGGIMHDGMFALVDGDGYLRSRKDKFGNPIIYYRGYIKPGETSEVGEKSQIKDLIEDIKRLLHE